MYRIQQGDNPDILHCRTNQDGDNLARYHPLSQAITQLLKAEFLSPQVLLQ